MRSVVFAALIVMSGAVLFAGCGQEVVQEFKDAQARLAEDPSSLDGVFRCDVTFCRKVGRKTGKRIGIGDEFIMKEKSRVNALVDFMDVEAGKVHAMHLVWLRPDMHEMFRKYVEVEVEAAETGYRSTIRWRKTDDLNYVKEEIQEGPDPSFSLKTRLNTSLGKMRVPGTYTLRVYYHRELMLEESFTLSF